jgi:uncharacterized protein (TIGR03067 family)
LLGAVDAPKDEAVAKDTKSLQGTWVVTAIAAKQTGVAIEEGKDGDVGDGIGKMTFAGEKWTFTIQVPGGRLGSVGNDKGEGMFTVDPSTDPKRIEIQAGGKIVRRGVYSLNGNKLTIRLNRASDKQPEYPKALEPESDDAGVVLTLVRRVKKDKQ